MKKEITKWLNFRYYNLKLKISNASIYCYIRNFNYECNIAIIYCNWINNEEEENNNWNDAIPQT